MLDSPARRIRLGSRPFEYLDSGLGAHPGPHSLPAHDKPDLSVRNGLADAAFGRKIHISIK